MKGIEWAWGNRQGGHHCPSKGMTYILTTWMVGTVLTGGHMDMWKPKAEQMSSDPHPDS